MIDDSNSSTPYEQEIEAEEFLKDNIEFLTEWMVDDSNNRTPCTKDIEVVQLSKNKDEEDSSMNRVSTVSIIEPTLVLSHDSQTALKDDKNKMKEDPPRIINQTKENRYTNSDDTIKVDDDYTTCATQMNKKQGRKEKED